MTLQEEIDNVHMMFADNKIDLHHANMETSRLLSKARQDLLDASRIVLERTGQIDQTRQSSSYQQPQTYAQPTFDEPFAPKQQPTNGHINNNFDAFLLTSAMLLREWLDSYIETRRQLAERRPER